MSAVSSHRPWSVDEFFAWQDRQGERYELVDGFPHPLRMMTGASNAHDDVVVNLIAELRIRLRGTGCRPFTADGSVETGPNRIRQPDVGIDCGPRDPKGRQAGAEAAIFEVLSPSMRAVDLLVKDGEYRRLPTLRHLIYVEITSAEILHWSRTGADSEWALEVLKGLDAVLRLGAFDIVLSLRDVYDGLELGEPIADRAASL